MKIPDRGAPAPHDEHSSETASSTPKQSVAAKRLQQSGTDLIGLDLSVEKVKKVFIPGAAHPRYEISKKPLAVPAVYFNKSTGPLDWKELIVEAKRTSEYEIEDKAGRKYTLGDVFTGGGNGAIRLMHAHDPVVSQYYIVKELARTPLPSSAEGQATPPPEHGEATAELHPMNEKLLQTEVNTPFLAKTPLVPHAVLRTQDRDFILLPVLDGDGHSLYSMVRKHPEQRQQAAVAVLLKGARSLSNMHENLTAHRDVKPENFLVERSGEVFLSDFGSSTQGAQDSKVTGTLIYFPFEALLNSARKAGKYDPFKADMWSLGVTAATFLGVNFLPDFIYKKSAAELIKTESGQHVIAEHYQDFRDNWQYFFAKKANGQWGEFDDFPFEDTLMTERFIYLHEAAPALFLPILKLLNPDPENRPAPKEFTQLLEALVGVNYPNEKKALRNIHLLSSRDARLQTDAFSQTIKTIYKNARQGTLIDLKADNLPSQSIGKKLLTLHRKMPDLFGPVMETIKDYPESRMSDTQFDKRSNTLLATYYTNIKGILKGKKLISRRVWPEEPLAIIGERPDKYSPSYLAFEALDIEQDNWKYRQHPVPKNVFSAANALLFSMEGGYQANEKLLQSAATRQEKKQFIENEQMKLLNQSVDLKNWAEEQRLEWEKSVHFDID